LLSFYYLAFTLLVTGTQLGTVRPPFFLVPTISYPFQHALFIFLAMALIFDTKINQMKYPLSAAEERLKEKLIKRKEKKKRKQRKIRSETDVHYHRVPPTHDYMKYWRVIQFWARNKYRIQASDLDILFFLYSEGYFNKTKYNEYNQLFRWDKNRFNRMMDDGWIHLWRHGVGDQKGVHLYELTRKGRLAITDIYKKLNGQEITESGAHMFGKDPRYTEKVYRNYIRKINQEALRERRLARQSRGMSRR